MRRAGGRSHRVSPIVHRQRVVRRPVLVTPIIVPEYVWNGTYWVSPDGSCFTKNSDGLFEPVECTAQSSFDGRGKPKERVIEEPLNKELISIVTGFGLGILGMMLYSKYSK